VGERGKEKEEKKKRKRERGIGKEKEGCQWKESTGFYQIPHIRKRFVRMKN
jgi:hypothetical protein